MSDDHSPSAIEDYEDVSGYTLDAEEEERMLSAQNECTFVWVTREGWPVGVIMSYVFRDGRFWLTAARHRKRIPAVRRDPRVSIVVSSRGTSIKGSKTVTYKGRCVVHDDNAELKAWFYPALAAVIRPDDPTQQRRFAAFLDSPHRVILEVSPEDRIGFDGDKMSAATEQSPQHRD